MSCCSCYSASESEYDEDKNDAEDSKEKRKHYLYESEKKEILKYLHEELQFCDQLKLISERDYYREQDNDLKSDMRMLYGQFTALLCNEEQSADADRPVSV